MTSDLHPRFEAVVPDELEPRRLALFLAVAFGVFWLPTAYLFASGVTFSGEGGSQGTLALNAILVVTSFSPAIATLVTRWATDEGLGKEQLLLAFDVRDHVREYAVAYAVPLVAAVLGIIVYYATFPDRLVADPLASTPIAERVAFGLVTILVPGSLMVLGEELGWRAYLLPKLAPLGRRRAVIATGVVWGIWHWPTTAMGANFGLDYPGAPWLGMLAMVWAPTLYGTLLAWVTFRSGSVWPAAIGHAAFNGAARWGGVVAAEIPNPALGPMSGGLVASLPWVVVAAWLLVGSETLSPTDATTTAAGD